MVKIIIYYEKENKYSLFKKSDSLLSRFLLTAVGTQPISEPLDKIVNSKLVNRIELINPCLIFS